MKRHLIRVVLMASILMGVILILGPSPALPQSPAAAEAGVWLPILFGRGPRHVDAASGRDMGDCTYPFAPCKTVGYALTQAYPGDTIRIAGGVYTETLVITTPVALTGGYTAATWRRDDPDHATILNGAGQDRVVDIQAGREFTTTLDGLTITGGDGGVEIGDSAAAIARCRIIRNFASQYGAGGILVSNSTVYVANSLIAQNTGAHYAGANGAIALLSYSDMTLDHCTVADNRAIVQAEGTNGIFVSLSGLDVVNSIIWGHEGEPFGAMVQNVGVSYSDIESSPEGCPFAGEGNICADPLFRNPTAGDYHLVETSPCADACETSDLGDDIDGDPRPLDSDRDGDAKPDMGYDELLLY